METGSLVSAIFFATFSMDLCASPLSTQSDDQLFKNYALSSCIATYYKGSDVAKDAVTAMQGYREFSNLPLKAFFDLNELFNNKEIETYKSKSGSLIELAYCLDFSNSEEVHKLLTKAKTEL